MERTNLNHDSAPGRDEKVVALDIGLADVPAHVPRDRFAQLPRSLVVLVAELGGRKGGLGLGQIQLVSHVRCELVLSTTQDERAALVRLVVPEVVHGRVVGLGELLSVRILPADPLFDSA